MQNKEYCDAVENSEEGKRCGSQCTFCKKIQRGEKMNRLRTNKIKE